VHSTGNELCGVWARGGVWPVAELDAGFCIDVSAPGFCLRGTPANRRLLLLLLCMLLLLHAMQKMIFLSACWQHALRTTRLVC
jgi:hypothetical protein